MIALARQEVWAELLNRENSWKKKGGPARWARNNLDGHNGDEVTSLWKNVD